MDLIILIMSKRFTDTEKWRKPFIRTLSTPYKLLWFYILDECDHAGIWHVEFDVASLRIGEEITKEEAIKQFDGHIIIVDTGAKWFIPDFISFQYGLLNIENRAHNSVINRLNKYGLLYKIKELISPLQGAKDKEQDKDKDKDKEKKEEKFKSEVYEFLDQYPDSLLKEFISYWTEPNKSRTKLRYELEKTWDCSRRLATWARNSKDFKKPDKQVFRSSNFEKAIQDQGGSGQMPESLRKLAEKKKIK